MWSMFMPRDNREQIEFLDSFSKKIISLTDTPNLVMADDCNTKLSPLDKQGRLTWKETKYRNSLLHFIKEINLGVTAKSILKINPTHSNQSL